MTIDGTKGAPHHEEHWKIETGLTAQEVADYVLKTFGAHGDDQRNPVGYSYAPLTGDLTLFRQVENERTKPLGYRDHMARLAEHEDRKKARAEAAKKASEPPPAPPPIPEPVDPIPEPLIAGEAEPTAHDHLVNEDT